MKPNNFQSYPKESSSWLIIPAFLIIILVLFGVYMYYQFKIYSKTNQDELLNYTYGEISHTSKTYMDFNEYYELTLPKDEKEITKPESNKLVVILPELNFKVRYEEYLDSCKGKRVQINFTKEPKYSEFKFDYTNNHFNYKVGLFEELYRFSDKLKSQDCYYHDEMYERIFFEDPYNNKFIEAISQDFISLKNEGFTDDEILEIVTLFVQSIKYGTDDTESNRYPYETIYEEQGNCLDKSVILAGILKNLGYETYIITGEAKSESHAIVGVSCEDGNTQYNSKEICYIETTNFLPVAAEIDFEIEEFIEVLPQGLEYKERKYGKNAWEFIDKKSKEAEATLTKMNDLEIEMYSIKIKMCDTNVINCADDGKTLSENYYYSDYDVWEYNKLVEEYNTLVEEYNKILEDYYRDYYEVEKALFGNVKMFKEEKP